MSKLPRRVARGVAALGILVATGCGSSTGSPSAPTPAPVPIVPFAQRLFFRVVESDTWPSSLTQYGYIDYSLCRTIQNLHTGTATVTSVQATVFGPGGEVLVSENLPASEGSMGYLAGYYGCRAIGRDNNRSHPAGVRYRLRYSVRFDDGMTGDLEGEAGIKHW
jgi:hypothetical protein